MDILGSWYFDTNFSYDLRQFEEVLYNTFKILSDNGLFIPQELHNNSLLKDEILGIDLKSKHISKWCKYEDSNQLRGKTIIKENHTNNLFVDIIRIDFNYHKPGMNIFIYMLSDILLPMTLNTNTFEYQWNLDRYYNNYERLISCLHEIDTLSNWDGNCKSEMEYTERGYIQIGYDLFLSEEVITREYERNPNPDFDLEAYLKKMKEAEAKIRESH